MTIVALPKQEEPSKDVELIRQELLDRGDEVVSFRQLVERFDEVEEEFKGVPWNLMQIYSNFNVLIGEKTPHKCRDCKQWRDHDGLFRRGVGAESRCPINRREVFEGNGYCYMFEPKESEVKNEPTM